ncbi:uncharacterized protein XM38_045930 [Halomicronema hongdechloris C2206]|uniref:Uncharacterized protein n=1 Tax=Halomicronema hongdechloris C2206 TaxID=1641165 RepID=A0A1V8NFL5_9CYAN|nr:hypothetical protein [Halomicronema hongdechloris]ASC73622.1 uncharacterized protein XM38_045930 [Halomicronema hongdechloris C2206]
MLAFSSKISFRILENSRYRLEMTLGQCADEQRLVYLFHHLCACLAMQQKAGGEPNASAIANRLGNRDLRRIISQLLQEEVAWEIKQEQLGKLGKATTGSVVEMLNALNQSLREAYQAHEEPYNRALTPEDVLTVLYKLVDLTPDERKALNLPSTDGLTLLRRALLILQTTGDLENHEMLFQVYRAAVGLNFGDSNEPLDTLEKVDDLVARVVRQTLEYLPERSDRGTNNDISPGKESTVRTLTRKAQREIRRLLTRSGNQVSPIANSDIVVNAYARKYLQPAFVTKLAQTVVANERLTDQFPVYLKRISIKPCGPLPFADRELEGLQQFDGPYPPLLHPVLRQLDQTLLHNAASELPGPGDYELASQEATEIIAEFYVKVPKDYSPAVAPIFRKLASQNSRRIDFSIRSTGVGGTLSHVIKVINSALLSDIPCLKDYFPIGHDIISTQKIIQDDVASPVWAHSLVKLCKKETVAQALQSGSSTKLGVYEEFSFADPIGHGDYCGFDFIISQAQSALHARLQAIRNSGVSPNTYIQHLCQRTERHIALKDAWNRLGGYPFSSLAMIGLIYEQILPPNSGDVLLQRTDPYIYFDACLSITEALLAEGLYRQAYRHLKRLRVLDDFVNQGLNINRPELDNFEIFSGALIIRYLLCLAEYYYLYDTADTSDHYLPPGCPSNVNREGLVLRAWEVLNQAHTHVRIRLGKYVAINEVSQGIFHPHYLLLGKIASLRAKLMLFFPQLVPLDNEHLPTDNTFGRTRIEASIHWGRIYLTEKARLYGAANGEGEVYACYAAMQCWVHLIAAYAEPEDLRSSRQLGNLSPESCLKWARTLRNHALISYADAGRRYYYQIKEKSGLPRDDQDKFGFYLIQKIPAIFEFRGNQQDSSSRHLQGLLALDMSLLAIDPERLPKLSPNHPERTIYLFGSNACYLFFARGLYMLCSNDSEEFSLENSSTEEEISSPEEDIDWRAKLQHSIRLFNMAWGIAEEGCRIRKDKRDRERLFYISRVLNSDDAEEEVSMDIPPEVRSIRDLYPRRITEIADLGKVFAAASMVLCAYTAEPEECISLNNNAEVLLAKLYSAQLLEDSNHLRALIRRQKRYNGHIAGYLEQAKHTILSYRNSDDSDISIETRRNYLIRELFFRLHMS